MKKLNYKNYVLPLTFCDIVENNCVYTLVTFLLVFRVNDLKNGIVQLGIEIEAILYNRLFGAGLGHQVLLLIPNGGDFFAIYIEEAEIDQNSERSK